MYYYYYWFQKFQILFDVLIWFFLGFEGVQQPYPEQPPSVYPDLNGSTMPELTPVEDQPFLHKPPVMSEPGNNVV